MLIRYVFLHCLTISSLLVEGLRRRNNVCKTFEDYATLYTNKNCWHNPDVYLNVPEIIQKYAGAFENYKIHTEDGYILNMFRIPRTNPKGVILLQHPIFSDSMTFVGTGNDSLALFLWHAGYDVWLNNQRGTRYSMGHSSLTPEDYEYWNFGFDKVALYDIPSQIEVIRNVTENAKVIFIGHSLGGTFGLVYSSLMPVEAARNVKVFVYMAVACYYKYNTNPNMIYGTFWPIVKAVVEYFKVGASFLYVPLYDTFKGIFYTFPFLMGIIEPANYFISGWTVGQGDAAIFNPDYVRFIQNISWPTALHIIQLFNAKTRFEMYDKDLSGSPPVYPIQNITAPTFLVYSDDDILTTWQDTELLYDQLPAPAKVYGKLRMRGLNHVDYNFGRDRKEILYDKLLDFFNKLPE